MKKVRIVNEWGEAYLHIRFKLENPSERIADLGLMSVNDVAVHLLHNQFPTAYVRRALGELAYEGMLDVYYCTFDDTWLEKDNRSKSTWRDIVAGNIFDTRTGEKYDIDSFVTKYALPKDVLEKFDGEQRRKLSILGRIRNWLRSGREEI